MEVHCIVMYDHQKEVWGEKIGQHFFTMMSNFTSLPMGELELLYNFNVSCKVS